MAPNTKSAGLLSPLALLALSALSVLASISFSVEAFAPPSQRSSRSLRSQCPCQSSLLRLKKETRDSDVSDVEGKESPKRLSLSTRRQALIQSTSAAATLLTSTLVPPALATENTINTIAGEPVQSYGTSTFSPAKRPLAYFVDSTIPPTLVPLPNQRHAAILKKLGGAEGVGPGKTGTKKSPLIDEGVNLNNMMNKAVFGTIDSVKGALQVVGIGKEEEDNKKKGTYASFLFLGANFDDESTAYGIPNADGNLAVNLLSDVCRPKVREGNTAIGLGFVPVSCQNYLEDYIQSGMTEDALISKLVTAGADSTLAKAHIPILQFAKQKRYPLLALSPDPADLITVQNGGLQSLDPQKRERYVVDARGFIEWTQEGRSKLYTERSLLKDFVPSASSGNSEEAAQKQKLEQGNYFAQQILRHETAATVLSQYAMSHPNSLAIAVAPMKDVRFLGGMNGRIPRVCRFVREDSMVDEECVTTILLNPSARETLSESKFLRLEIGTAPQNWAYQTKVADYLWFSSMPKVNMLPRLMNEQ